jgi:hypothetical protein
VGEAASLHAASAVLAGRILAKRGGKGKGGARPSELYGGAASGPTNDELLLHILKHGGDLGAGAGGEGVCHARTDKTHRHADTQTRRHADTQTHTRCTQTLRLSDAQIHTRHTDTRAHRRTHDTHRHADAQTRRHTNTQTH